MVKYETDILIIGAGIVGIATAYYLKKLSPAQKITLVDQGQPMAFTSAQSGENYRNWWPHPTMKALTDHSIDLMEQIAIESGDLINMTRRGYLLATRETDISGLIKELNIGYGSEATNNIRFHNDEKHYQTPEQECWRRNPDGVDVLQNSALIQYLFPSLASDINNIIHIRRAGTISSQQMGQFMLEKFRAAGGKRVTGEVTSIEKDSNFQVTFKGADKSVSAAQIINAAGPFLNNICEMLGTSLPISNILHQKIAFPDKRGVVPRKLPFTIDLDPQHIDWSDEDRALLEEYPVHAWVTEKMPGAIHCRPEGGDNGNWVKLGWAFNESSSSATLEPIFNENFPEIVLRGAARLQPSLKAYYNHLPREMVLYGGYYTMTEENWPLIGPTDVEGLYVNGAMSGFGTMAACAGGELCAQWVLGHDKPNYANDISPTRYNNPRLLTQLRAQKKGVL